ncbi:MAG: sulfatase [Planctomycetota bacterium]
MKTHRFPIIALLASFVLPTLAQGAGDSSPPPNIVVIVADDLGWSDVGFNGCKEIPTPRLDALAKSGVVFSAGYVTHPYCSPSRAGLLTGRYQQRFGHEGNPSGGTDGEPQGLPLSERLLSNVLSGHGYRTGAIGKWHLGDVPERWPTQRGFDEWYGFSGGGMSYWGDVGKKDPIRGVLRDGVPVPRSELTYLTDDFSREAVAFIERNRDQPFFLYLAYNAPHAPDQVTRAHLKKTEHIEYGGRAVYGAMVAGMDEGIGKVLDALEKQGMRDRTLVFFVSDNGGRKEHAVNFPFRGHKGMLFEGGIRVPFCVSWPGVVAGDRRSDTPASALDIFPTALAAAGIVPPESLGLDGVNLLPYLKNPSSAPAPRTLYWRYACGDGVFGRALRDEQYKMVSSVYKEKTLLFDLQADPYEQHDIAADHPEIVRALTERYARWENKMVQPLWEDGHGPNVRNEELARQTAIDDASRGERKP